MNEDSRLLPRKRSEQFQIADPESPWNHDQPPWDDDGAIDAAAATTNNHTHQPAPASRGVVLGAVLFLIALAASCSQPTKDSLNARLACRATGSLYCDPVLKQIILSNLNLVCSIASSSVSMVVSANVGPLSDCHGRTPFFRYYLVVNWAASAALLWIYWRSTSLPFWWIVSTAVVASASGGNYSLLSLSNAYVSDVVAPAHRIYSLGLVSAAIFAGSTLGPVLAEAAVARWRDVSAVNGDILASELLPIKMELAIQAVAMVLASSFLQESRSDAALAHARAARAQTHRRWVDAVNFLRPLQLLALPAAVVRPNHRPVAARARRTVVLLVATEILMALVDDIVRTIITQYGIFRFGWTATELGYFSSINSLASALVLLLISPALSNVALTRGLGLAPHEHRFDSVDFTMLMVALGNQLVALALLYASTSTSQMYFAGNLLTLSLIGGPTITSAMLKFYPDSKVGEFFSAQSILKNALGLLSPIIFQHLYKRTLQLGVANLSFAVYAGIIMVCVGLVMLAKRRA